MLNEIKKYIDIINEIKPDPLYSFFDRFSELSKSIDKFYYEFSDITNDYTKHAYNVFDNNTIEELRDISEEYFIKAEEEFGEYSVGYSIARMMYEYYHGDVLNKE